MFKTLAGLGIAGIAVLGAAPIASADTTVNPTPPTFVDTCGTANDTYTIPAQKGVSYYVGGTKMNNGVRKVDAASPTVTIFPVADPGYQLAQNGSWSHTFDTKSGQDGTGCAQPSTTAAAAPSASSSPANCDSVTAPIKKGEKGYSEALDTDHDGVACEDAGSKPAVTAGPSTNAATTPQTGKTLPHTGIDAKTMVLEGGGAIGLGALVMGASGYSMRRRVKG